MMIPQNQNSTAAGTTGQCQRRLFLVAALCLALLLAAPSVVRPATAAAAADGEIWQWALGRNVWTDPDLQPYTHNLGRDYRNLDVNVQGQGFRLDIDGMGTVNQVDLFNDTAALGVDTTGDAFRAYRGALPFGLTWSNTFADLGIDPNSLRIGGIGGIPYETPRFVTDDGYAVVIHFLATSPDQLYYSPMVYIGVSQA